MHLSAMLGALLVAFYLHIRVLILTLTGAVQVIIDIVEVIARVSDR